MPVDRAVLGLRRDPECRQRTQLVLSHCPGLFADSAAVVRRCEEVGERTVPATFILPWGIDLAATRSARSRDDVRKELGLGGEFVFLFTRGLEPIYRVDVLLESFRDFHRGGGRGSLLLSSSGSLRDEVARWREQQDAELRAAIHLLGGVAHHRLLDLYGAADAYISTAASDGTSIALLEAMYFGLTPIVADIGGNPEWVRHGQNGWLARVGAPAEFADAMRAAAQLGGVERQSMATVNHEQVRSRADWHANMRTFAAQLAVFSGTQAGGGLPVGAPSLGAWMGQGIL